MSNLQGIEVGGVPSCFCLDCSQIFHKKLYGKECPICRERKTIRRRYLDMEKVRKIIEDFETYNHENEEAEHKRSVFVWDDIFEIADKNRGA